MEWRRINANPTWMQCDCNVSGEDRTPFEFFIAGIRGWEADVRQAVQSHNLK